MTSTETATFAASIQGVVRDHAGDHRWTPTRPTDDTTPALADHLARAGWYELASDPDAIPFIGPAAVELGRGAAPLREVDALLGGSPLVGGMTRYAAVGDVAVLPGPSGLRTATVLTADPVPYGDGIGACLATVDDGQPVPAEQATLRERAWIAGMVGYLAGMASRGLELALDHAANRIAFGGPLTRIESVQQRLADAALDRDGLTLLAADGPNLDALAFAGPAACGVLAQCHQVVGAIGYTLEFPLQTYSRRARAVTLWSDAWIEARS